jgi:hypothetical protein
MRGDFTGAASAKFNLADLSTLSALMLAIRDKKVPVMAYSWGKQPTTACPALQMADGGSHPDLPLPSSVELDRPISPRSRCSRWCRIGTS